MNLRTGAKVSVGIFKKAPQVEAVVDVHVSINKNHEKTHIKIMLKIEARSWCQYRIRERLEENAI